MTRNSPNLFSKSAEPLYLQVKPSRLFAGFLILGHMTAALALMYIDLPTPAQILLGLMLATSLYRTLSLYVLMNSSRSILRLVWDASGKWRVWDGSGREHEATLTPDYFVHPKLIILGLKLQGVGRRAILLWPDSLDTEITRRLRRRLREMRKKEGEDEHE